MPRKTVYVDIAAKYRQMINDGTLRPGDELPSQRVVMEEFGASGTTVNRAFRMLKDEGLTVAKPGVGTVVADQTRTHITGAGRIDRLNRTDQPYGAGETSINHQAALRSIDDAEIADLLGVELREEVVVRTRAFIKDGKATSFATSVIHTRAITDVPEILSGERLPKFWQTIYTERTGETITKSPERRMARHATRFELEQMGIEAPPEAAVPVLVLQNVFHNADGPIEVWTDVYAPGVAQVDSS